MLALIEAGAKLPRLQLKDPLESLAIVSRDLEMSVQLKLADRTYCTAIDIQEELAFSANRAIDAGVIRFGGIDMLVNNAGVARVGSLDQLSEEAWDANLDVNLKGTFLMCRAVVPVMKKQMSGRIINAASYAAIVPRTETAAYAASKAGVVYLTRVLAGELGPWNITVNCYAPGMVPTDMNHYDQLPETKQKQLLDMLTLRRWGSKRDLAHLVCFLASDLAGYITGTLIDVSGGKLATQLPVAAFDKAREEGLQWPGP